MPQQSVLNSALAAPGSSSVTSTYCPAASGSPSEVNIPPPRPMWADAKAMKSWNAVLLEALTRFRTTKAEPKGRAKSQYSIRNKTDWDDIYETLELAREKYNKDGGPIGWWRKTRRKAADNIAPLSSAALVASKFVPDNQYSTPVLGAVGVLLDAVKQAAHVRKEVLEGFDGLVPIFSDVELFMGDFPGDPHIKNASLELTVTILTALEQAIGFFISNELIRGGKVLVKRGEYEQGLRDSLKEIQTKSTKLMEEAIKSNIHQLNHYSQETQKLMWHMAEEQQEARVEMKGGFNSLKYLLDEYLRRKDAVIEQKERELEAERRENVYLAVENQRLRSASPMLYSPWTPQLPIQTAIVGQYVDQEALRRILNTRDLDQIDMAFILDKKADIPAKLQVQAEQLINTPLFCDWIVSASSAKLLVQWDGRHPKTIAEVSPLSIFCTTMVRALQENERFISVQWFCGRHIDPAEAWPYMGGHAMIASLIDQLLRQRTFDTRWLHREINLADLEAGDLVGRTRLLGWLVRQLPQTVTLFFIVDGVVLYERDEYWDEAGPVLAFLLSLTADTSLQAAVKVLFTSAPGPGAVREPFALDELVLDVDTLPRITWAPSEERLARELGYSLG